MTDQERKAALGALKDCAFILGKCSVTAGHCFCGVSMDMHTDLMNCDHSPIDMGQKYADDLYERIRVLIAAHKQSALTPHPMDEDVRRAIELAREWLDHDMYEVYEPDPSHIETLIRAAQFVSPYKDYTWEDVAMLVQENRALKEAATAQRCEEVTEDDLSVIIAEEISRNTIPVDYTEIGNAPAKALARYFPNGLKIVDKSAEQHPTKGEEK